MSKDKPLVLVVDDDVPIQILMQSLLREFGFTTLTAGSGEAALNVVKEGARPDLVLLDIHMPGMSAADAIRALREEDGLDAVPVMILSGERLSPQEVAAMGANGAIQKPFDIAELVTTIREQVAA